MKAQKVWKLSGGRRVERPVDETGVEKKNKEQPLPYKGGYIKGVRWMYKDTEGLALLQPHVYLSADRLSNVCR